MSGGRVRGRRRRWIAGLIVFAGLAIAGGVVALYLANHDADDDAQAAPKPAPVAATPVAATPAAALGPDGTPVITLDDAARTQSDIALLTLKPAPQPVMIAAFGTVLDPAPLAELMQKAAQARAARDEAGARAGAAAAEYRRDQTLFRDQHNVSAQALEAAAANDRAAAAVLAGREADLGALGDLAANQWGAVLGPDIVAGGAFARRLARGEEWLVSVGVPPDRAAELAAPARAWAAPASPSPAGAAAPRLELRLISALPRVDPRAQAPLLLYAAPSAGGLLAGMNIAVSLPGAPRPAALRVPAEAVLWWQGRGWVYRRIAPGRFARAAIATDQPAPEGGFIIADPEPASAPMTIVGRGAASVFSEEFRGQIQLGEGDSDP